MKRGCSCLKQHPLFISIPSLPVAVWQLQVFVVTIFARIEIISIKIFAFFLHLDPYMAALPKPLF